MGVVVSGDEGGDSIGALSNAHQIGDQQMPISLFSDGQRGLCSDIINQYGQLIGEYSRLDDELWFSKPQDGDDDDAVAKTDQGLETNFTPSYEYTVHQEQLSKSIENPVSDGGAPYVKEASSSKDSSLEQSQTSSPVSVLHRRRSYSSVRKKATKRARSENGHFAKCNSHGGLQSVGPALPTTEQSQSIQPESYMESSSLLDEATEASPPKQPRTKKVSDLLLSSCGDNQSNQTSIPESCLGHGLEESGSWEGEQDPNPIPSPKLKQPKMAVKKCTHCESTNTPQWREGPMGLGTLCNACGVRYRHGRLSSEYRPLKSPTFNPSLHTNLKPTPKRKQRKLAVKKCMHCESTKTPQRREGSMGEGTPCDGCGVQDRHGRLSSECCPLESPTLNPSLHSNTKPSPKRKQPKTAVKKCMHCESTKTPQWREGPMGQGTLCNACGVQYRHGRLFPEYRPLKSPTYNPSLHSHLPKKVQQMRMHRNTNHSAVSGDSEQLA